MDSIPFLVALPEDGEAEKTMGIFSRDKGIVRQSLPVEKLKANLSQTSEAVLAILGDIRKVGNFKLQEITFQVEVSAEGGISLVGTSKIGGKGAISLTFSEHNNGNT